MERIVINGNLYKCKNGTNDKIRELLKTASNAPAMDHETGIAYDSYNAFLENIMDTKDGVFIENAYQTN